MKLAERMVCAAAACAATLLLFATFWWAAGWRGASPAGSTAVVSLRLLPWVVPQIKPPTPGQPLTQPSKIRMNPPSRAVQADSLSPPSQEEVLATGTIASTEFPASAPRGSEPVQALNLTASRESLSAAAGVGAQTKVALVAAAGTYISPTARAVRNAEVPECMSREALRHQPPTLLGIGVSGILVTPSWIKAGATGKCLLP